MGLYSDNGCSFHRAGSDAASKSVPSNNVCVGGSPMPLYRFNNRVILFIHIPKTGGSAIETVLRQSGAAEALMTSRTEWRKPNRYRVTKCSAQHLHLEGLSSIIDPSFIDFSFAITRNPYSRIASEFRWRTRGRWSSTNFDSWFRRRMRGVARDPFEKDNHIRQQIHFVDADVEIFRFEDGLKSPVDAALRALGVSRQNVEVPSKRRSSQTHPIRVSTKTLTHIRDLYAVDFGAFDYDPDNPPDGLFEIVRPRSFFFSRFRRT